MRSAVDSRRLMTHLRELTERIGVRLAGLDGERAAADYIAHQFDATGACVSVETFPVYARAVTTERLEIEIGGAWATYPCSLFSSTPGTGGQPLEAPLVFFEAPAEHGRTDLSHLRGKAVVHLGTHIESRERYRRLIEARPAFLLFVDIRYPGSYPLADGMFPAYTRAIGAVPTINVAFQDAWHWKVAGATAARLSVSGGMRASESQNVVAELLGNEGDAELLVLGAHHDTQANSVGADDNATGVAGLLELARVLAPCSRRRTIRLISFGAEEQLSVGSATYVRRHREELARRARLMLNLDSYGSHLGWTEMVCNGSADLAGYARSFFERQDLPITIRDAAMPYADHFPFVAAGVPGITLMRHNCTAGRFFHHRPDDDLSRVAPELMARLLDAVAALSDHAASVVALPFATEIPEVQRASVQRFWEDLFDGWTGTELLSESVDEPRRNG